MQSFDAYGDGLGRGESKSGFWGVLAQKAKEILEDENSSPQNDIMPEKLKSHSFNAFSPLARGQVIIIIYDSYFIEGYDAYN